MPLARLVLILTVFLGLHQPAHGACTSPLAATQHFLDNLQKGDGWQPANAIACFPSGEGMDKRAIQLKQVLDAKGLFIDFDALSTDPDFVNEAGQAKQVLHKRLPVVYPSKVGDGWQFSEETVGAVPALYEQAFTGISQTIRSLLPAPLHKPLPGGLQGWQVVLFGLLVLVSFLAGRLAHFFLQGQIVRLARRIKVPLNAEVVGRMRGPLTWAAAGAVFLIGIADLQLGVRASSYLHTAAQAALSIAIVVVLLRIVDMLTDLARAKAEHTDTKMDDQLIPLASRALKVIIWALGLLSILDNLGIDVTSLLAGVTISGLAIALAAKDTVENLFGSMMIFVDRPFQIGDYIVVGGNEGTVEEVGFRSTRLRTVLGSVVTIPNGAIASARVDNMGLRAARRMRFTLGFTYDAKREQINQFCQQTSALFDGDERVLDGHEVRFVNFGDSALEVMIHAFVADEGWSNDLAVHHELKMKVWEIAENLGLGFAFPSQSLYVESVPAPAS